MKKIIFSVLFLFTIIHGQTIQDARNSSTANLAAGGVFTGYARDLITYSTFSSILVTVYANEPSATNGLVIQFSADSTNWRDSVYTSIDSVVMGYLHSPVKQRYYRVKYTNGSDSVTSLTIKTILFSNPYDVARASLQTDGTQKAKILDNSGTGISTSNPLIVRDADKVIYSEMTDTLISGTDTLYEATLNGVYSEVIVTVSDTAGASAYIDTVKFYSKDTVSNTWVQIGAEDLISGSVVSIGVPGNGVSKSYLMKDKFILVLRVAQENTVYVEGRTTYISIRAKK